MAVEFGDITSGFRHSEVIRFINNEVLMNGGGPEFYMTFRSRSWNEIEDQLHTILVDPKVPRTLKRACTWSALALSVRVAARQREQQARRVGRLQSQVGERESASWTLVSELQRLRDERDQAAAQLVSTQTALQEAMDEREVLLGRLLQAERSALTDVPELRAEHYGTSLWSHEEEKQEELGLREAHNAPYLDGQMPAAPILSYVPGISGSWAQAVNPVLQMPVPQSLPLNKPLPGGIPYSTPVPCPVVMESGTTAAAVTTVVPQMASPGIYPPGVWVALGPQEAVPSAWGQISHRRNECPEIQDVNHLGDRVSQSKKGPEKPYRTALCGDSRGNNHKGSLVTPQVMAATEKKIPEMNQETVTLEINSNHGEKGDSITAQGMAAQGNKNSLTPRKYPGIPRRVLDTGVDISHNIKEVSVTPQESATQVNKTSPILKKYPGIVLKKPDVGNIISCKQKEDPKTSQGTAALREATKNCQKEDTITFQQMTPRDSGGSPKEKRVQMMPQGTDRFQIQKEEPNSLQSSPLGKSKSYFMNKCPPKQLPLKQKSKQPQGTKSSDSKQQEKPLSHRTPVNWVCPVCKAVNRSWCKGCSKCAKAGAQLERKDFY
ncbi:testis-expressed protein 13C-1-like [Acomys russatus]|uniref:testis-expressed protein 13C-1-like n=1 Tax=Acomys russatus TaxID=60746 RepID=UPI0021E20827|nr:testis-expressed protein 13C-1-like [Acomys russatus]